jgi:hypothetical protein
LTDTPNSIEALLERIELAMRRVRAVLSRLSDAQLQTPEGPDGWSAKDAMAHMMWWDQWLLWTLPPAPGSAPQVPPPLVEHIPDRAHWADEMNQRVYDYYRRRDLTGIQTAFAQVQEQLLQRVRTLSMDDLLDPEGMSAQVGQPVGPLVFGIYEHYEEHAHALEAQWVRN